MLRVSKLLLIAGVLAGGAGVALAEQAEPEPAEPAEPPEPPPGDPATDPAAAPPAPTELAGWPTAIIARPLTLPEGLLRVQGDLRIGSFGDATTVTIVGSGGYGVSDQLEVGGSYAVRLKELEAKGPLTVYGAFRMLDGQLDVAGTASLTYDVAGESLGAAVGAAVQAHLGPNFAVFTPGYQLAIGLDPGTSARLNLPVGLALQATPNIYASALTTIASFGIEPSGGNTFISDATPLVASVFYTPQSAMDFGVAVDFADLQHAGDAFTVVLIARLFVK